MFKDYKFGYVKRDASGYISEATLHFYKGDYQTITISAPKIEIGSATGTTTNAVVYVRAAGFSLDELSPMSGLTAKASSGERRFTAADFGQIKTDDELAAFCNGQLAKAAPLLQPISKQTIAAAIL